MEVRAARVEDAGQIALVHVRSWQQTYRGLVPQEYLDSLDLDQRASSWRRELAKPDSPGRAILVLDSGGTLVGFASLGPARDADQNPEQVGEVRAIYLLADAWGKGLGRQLMAAAVERLAAAGFEQAILWVLDSNGRARRFYEAGGWFADGAVKDDDSRGFQMTEVRYTFPFPRAD
jgi:GNAT superfamily N-acetyltransferase